MGKFSARRCEIQLYMRNFHRKLINDDSINGSSRSIGVTLNSRMYSIGSKTILNSTQLDRVITVFRNYDLRYAGARISLGYLLYCEV